MTATQRIAVIGTGIGQAHLRALTELPDLYEVIAICDLDHGAAASAAEPFGARPTTDLQSVLSDHDVGLVSICTPPFLHESHTIDALRAGKNVICEKPLVGSLAALDRVVAASHETGGRVFPVFNYRYGNSFGDFLELAQSGQFGQQLLATVEVAYLRGPEYYANPWRGTRAGELGGCLASHAIHHFDLLLAAFGQPASAVALTDTRVNDIETEDCAAGAIRFDDGALASFAVTLGSARQYSQLRLVYANAVVEFGPGPYETITEGTWLLNGTEQPPTVDAASGFTAMFREIHRALNGDDHRAPSLDDARQSLELLTALYRAAADIAPAAIPEPMQNTWYDRWT